MADIMISMYCNQRCITENVKYPVAFNLARRASYQLTEKQFATMCHEGRLGHSHSLQRPISSGQFAIVRVRGQMQHVNDQDQQLFVVIEAHEE